ncbi:MAG: hypothetical protein ACRDRZ_03605 [Pseudonocardiaceae bacterium]
MSFPDTPRDVVVELYVLDGWVDVTSDVRARDGIDISRGRRDEAATGQPGTATMTLDNSAGNYSLRNPLGAYWGSIGRNTPLRVGLRTQRDTFGRTVSGGWGSADTGQVWTIVGAGGSVLASDWNVAAGVGTQSVPVANAYRFSYLATTAYRDVDVAVTATLPFTDVAGGQVEPANIALRGQSTTDYYLARVAVTTAEAVTVALHHADGTVLAAAVTVAGLTHSSAQALRVRAQAEGHTLRAKVWAAAGDEPHGWQVTAHTELITGPGWVGVRSGVASGNANTKPIVFTYDDLAVSVPRFAGEVAAWPQRWDVTGTNVTAPIEVAGITRRLGQGASPLHSALRRGITRDIETPVAYWPAEDGENSTRIASGLPGGGHMFTFGSPDFAANTDFDSSDAIPALNNSVWFAPVPAHTLADRCQVRFLLSVPATGEGGGNTPILVVGTTGGMDSIWVLLNSAGNLALNAFTNDGTLIYDSGFVGYGVNGAPAIVSVEFEQVGSDVELNLVTLEPGQGLGEQLPGGGDTIAGRTCGIAKYIWTNHTAGLDAVALGHISVHTVWSSLFDLSDQLNAWSGETAGARLARLCGEEDISFSHVGALADTAAMGAQRPRTLLEQLADCAAADLGTLYEPRGDIGVAYRTRTSLYNQPVTLDLDYGAAQVAPPFEPVDDDQSVRNDVTAKRVDGSEARAVADTGRMSVADPSAGGVGRYDESVTVAVAADAQLLDIAAWRVHLGTVDETRYPTVRVDLTAPAVVVAGIEGDVLTMDIDDRLTISNPRAGSTPDQISLLARGYSEHINIFAHALAFTCSPESPYQVAELDAETRLDSDTSTLASGVDTDDTSLSVAVAVADGVLWTTAAAQLPLPILVGGEQMSVTAISGTASPQTFTVTRSVNGVVKSHAAGAQVHVANPVILAL